MFNLYLRAKEEVGFSSLVKELNVVAGTAKRWEEKQEVPADYYMDLKRILKEPIDLSSLSYREKGQFYTLPETAKECLTKIKEVLKENGYSFDDYYLLEPSAGQGAFLQTDEYLAMDIEPNNENVLKQDFLLWEPDNKNYIVIGNPPFGLRGQQALRFLNKSLSFADFVCFILPPLFNSDGRGNPKKRVNGNLLYSGPCSSSYVYPDGSKVKVETIFQIWTAIDDLGEKINDEVKPKNFSIYSLSNGGTSSTTRNKDKIGKCDFYLPSTCFGKENMTLKEKFEDLPQQRGYGIIGEKVIIEKAKEIQWDKIAFTSTNGALNLRRSLIIEALLQGCEVNGNQHT